MRNSSPYRKPPIKRTRDTFIDDQNSIENPRIDFGEARHSQVRRDKDNIRSLGVTLYDIDYAIKTFIEKTMQLKVEDNGEFINVPVLYANSEKWASIQKNGYIKDKKGKTLAPLITFHRSNVTMKQEMRRNKVASINQIAYVMQQHYNQNKQYDRFSVMSGMRRPHEYFLTPIPDYVDVTYDFILWCEYQTQLNHLIEQFVYFSGQSFGDRNFFKFSSNLDSVSLEDTNITGQDRLVRAPFQLTIHGYLLPKDIANQTTTKRVVSPNKITFVSEAFVDINSGIVENFRPLNLDARQRLEDYERKINDFTDTDIGHSPDVYTTENE